MLLPNMQIQRFYDSWLPLLQYVNQKMNVLPRKVVLGMLENSDPLSEKALRDALWNNPWILDDYVRENPNEISSEDLALVASWRNFHFGDFTIYKVENQQGIFIEHEEPRGFYLVYPLYTPFEHLLPQFPIMVRTAILPFENVIIYDGSLVSYAVGFKAGIRGLMEEWYVNAKERGAIIKSFLPPSPMTKEQQVTQAKKTNRSVVRAFRSYLNEKGLSKKIIDRDMGSAQQISEFLIDGYEETTTLHDVKLDHFAQYFHTLKGAKRQASIVASKRLVKFLKETERMDWDLAEDILIFLKSQ